MKKPNSPSHGTPLQPDTMRRLRALVVRVGDYEAARLLCVGQSTLARALAGFGLRASTSTAIRLALDVVESGKAA
jgi:hypothetical protein